MDYKILSKEERNRIVVEFMLGQERDHYCHSINKERYEKILSDNSLEEGDFKSQVQKLKNDIEKRIVEVEQIIAHTLNQLPSQEEIAVIIKKIELRVGKQNGR